MKESEDRCLAQMPWGVDPRDQSKNLPGSRKQKFNRKLKAQSQKVPSGQVCATILSHLWWPELVSEIRMWRPCSGKRTEILEKEPRGI